ncbi:MAG: GNAT family N-acetyltransferase [Devosia sp.]|uniref:GNAT family N-acetyltransferase n=1 Tax=Devosia sp. 66-22 TaxID=1895753 RepID=UPI000AFFB050|nr:GNAT family N-acetyltransferase [Devosia sp. 66-22]MBN9345261.1 GNAT family N-acetyltransferase [Devosia sp.]
MAGADDVADLVAADPYAQVDAGRRAQIAEWVDAGQCFVAERGGRIVGYCVLNRELFDSFFIKLVAVAETERRSGVGTAMIEHLVGLIPPGEKLWTSTNKSNAPMRSLLPRLGFIASGRIDNLDDGDPELVFVRLPTS